MFFTIIAKNGEMQFKNFFKELRKNYLRKKQMQMSQ